MNVVSSEQDSNVVVSNERGLKWSGLKWTWSQMNWSQLSARQMKCVFTQTSKRVCYSSTFTYHNTKSLETVRWV